MLKATIARIITKMGAKAFKRTLKFVPKPSFEGSCLTEATLQNPIRKPRITIATTTGICLIISETTDTPVSATASRKNELIG